LNAGDIHQDLKPILVLLNSQEYTAIGGVVNGRR
jgi:hypothetical protein